MKFMFALLIVCVLFSCNKKKDDADTQAPVVTVLSPANNQVYTAGQTIQIEGRATDNDKVSEFHIHITNKTTGALLRDIHSYPGQATGTASYSFIADAGLSYSIRLIANDPSLNSGTAEVSVTVN